MHSSTLAQSSSSSNDHLLLSQFTSLPLPSPRLEQRHPTNLFANILRQREANDERSYLAQTRGNAQKACAHQSVAETFRLNWITLSTRGHLRTQCKRYLSVHRFPRTRPRHPQRSCHNISHISAKTNSHLTNTIITCSLHS